MNIWYYILSLFTTVNCMVTFLTCQWNIIYSSSIKGGQKRTSLPHTWTMFETIFQYVKGTACRKNCHCLMRAIHLSTWIRTLAIDTLSTNSGIFICCLPWRNWGVISLTPFLPSQLAHVHPRSAIMASPDSIKSLSFDWFVMALSLIDPSYSSLMNVGTPLGDMPTSALWVLHAL